MTFGLASISVEGRNSSHCIGVENSTGTFVYNYIDEVIAVATCCDRICSSFP